MSVYLIQCLCPQRHCIAGITYEAGGPSNERLAAFRLVVAQLIKEKTINPWCGICDSRDWHYEMAKTRYRTMEEAEGPLAEAQAAQAAAREFFRRSKN